MCKVGKILWYIFPIMIVIKFLPEVLVYNPDTIIPTGDQMENILAVMDLVIASTLGIYAIVEQKHSERVLFDIKIGEDDFSLEKYKRYNIGHDGVFVYEHYSKHSESGIPRYGIPVEFVDDSVCSVCIPLSVGVSTDLKGDCMELSDVTVIAKKNGRLVAMKSKGKMKLPINMLVKNEKPYIIRIQLLCNHDLEVKLIDSRIYICFSIAFHEGKRRVHKKFVFVQVQNVGGASTSLLSVTYKSNFITYVIETKKLVARR